MGHVTRPGRSASVHIHTRCRGAVPKRLPPFPLRRTTLEQHPKKMGNDVAKNCANRMAIGAMSNVTDLERPVIQRMSEKLTILRRGRVPKMS